MENLVTLEKAYEIAKEEWRNHNCSARVKCTECFDKWVKNGANDKERPPVWPPSFSGKKCPICGQKLPRASIPF